MSATFPTVQLAPAETRANSIRAQIGIVEKAKSEAKALQENIEAELRKDEDYRKTVLEIEHLQDHKKYTKKKLMKHPAMEALQGKLKDLRGQAKTGQMSLSDYLKEYVDKEGTNKFDGKLIEPIYKLKKVK